MEVVSMKGPRGLESVDDTVLRCFKSSGSKKIDYGVVDVDYNVFKEGKIIEYNVQEVVNNNHHDHPNNVHHFQYIAWLIHIF